MSTESTASRRRSAEERRDELMDAAIAVMSERGVAAATTRAIAEHAGLAQGVFHYCFRSKNELFAALFEREISRTLGSASLALREHTDVRSGLRAALEASVAPARTNPDYHLALAELSLTVQRTPTLAPLAVWEQEQYRLQITDALAAWSAERSIRWSAPLEDVASYLVAVSAGVTSTWLADRDDARADATIAVATMPLTALSTESESSR